MKPRGQLIIDEFDLLRSVSRKSGLELPPEYAHGRSLFRKRDKLFKKLRLNPDNEHHVAFVCSIVYDHLYGSQPSAAVTKFGDDQDFDLLVRFLRFKKVSRLRRRNELYRTFVKSDKKAAAEYGADATLDRFRVRMDRAARKLIAGSSKITKKRHERLSVIMPDLLAIHGKSAKS
jgi:hypothetical protein